MSQRGCIEEIVESDAVNIKRRPVQKMSFKDVGNFVNSLIGKSSVVVFVGRKVEDGQTVDDWRAYHREPSNPKNHIASWKVKDCFHLEH